MSENDPHHLRLSTVETRQKTLENQFTSFTSRYEKDRQKDEETNQILFSKLNSIGSEISSMEGSRGKVPASVLVGIPATVVPIIVLLGAYFMLHITPLKETLIDTRENLREAREQQIETVKEMATHREWRRIQEKYFIHNPDPKNHE